MGMSSYSYVGYGVVIMNDDLDSDDVNLPAGIEAEHFGDHVLGEECGVFFKVADIPVQVNFSSVAYVADYVEEYTQCEVNDVPTEIAEWFDKMQAEFGDESKLGVFMVTYFG